MSWISRWGSMCANTTYILGQFNLAFALLCNTIATTALRALSEVKLGAVTMWMFLMRFQSFHDIELKPEAQAIPMRSIKLRIVVRLAQCLYTFPPVVMSDCSAQHTIGDPVVGGFSSVYRCCGVDKVQRALKVPRLHAEQGLKVRSISLLELNRTIWLNKLLTARNSFANVSLWRCCVTHALYPPWVLRY